MYVWRVIATLAEDLPECHIDRALYRAGRHGIAMGDVRADCLLAARPWVDSLRTLSVGGFFYFQAGRHEAAPVRAGNRLAVPSTL